MVTQGYYKRQEATRNTFSDDGWLYTGDIGYYDADKYVFMVYRIKELIKYKGFQVPPAEVEGVLLIHSKIKNAVIVGTLHNIAGELPTAFVVKHDNELLTEENVKEFIGD